MEDHVRIKDSKILLENWGTILSVTLEYQRRNGKWQTLVREIYDHGSAAAVLLFDPARDQVILTKQFRLPAHMAGGDGRLIEVCAGLLDNDDPADCARREAMEETGVEILTLEPVCRAFASPGSLTEMLYCFIGTYDGTAARGPGGGLAEEGEDIEVLEMGFDEAHAMIASGTIIDMKSIILLQHLALCRALADK